MAKRETIQKGLELMMAGGLAAIGFWLGKGPTEVMVAVGAGMGASWLASWTEASVKEGLQRWLGEEGVLEPNIERVLGEALRGAAQEVRQKLPQNHSYRHWQGAAPQEAQRLLGEFKQLEKDGPRLIRVWAQDEARRAQMVALMSNEGEEIGQAIDQQITALLQTEGETDKEYAYVLHFLRQELAERWYEHFVQRLKRNTPAWGACQRLWQGSLSATLGQVGRRDVVQMKAALDKIVAAQEKSKGISHAPHVKAFVQALLPLLSQALMGQLRHIKEDTSQIKEDTSEIKAAIVVLLNKVEQLQITPPSPTETASWTIVHPYPALPDFTGRWEERALLSEWLSSDDRHPLLVLRALGGFGKSALAWHWLHHDVDEQQWERVFWWSFYEQDARIETFLRVLFYYVAPEQPLPQNNYELLLALASHLRQQPTLIILDGFERELRAYGTMGAAYLGDNVPSEKLSFGERAKLVEHLLTIPSIADVTRRATVIDQLPLKIKANVASHSAAKTHIFNIVTTCLQYPNGMQELRDILQFFEHDSIPMQQFKQALNRLLPKGLGFDQNKDRVPSLSNDRDCISPLAERFLRQVIMPRSKSKLLMTTRLRPRILERHRQLVAGCREEELTALTPADGVALFRRLGIVGARHEIEQVGERVGYHPLSLRLLAGAIMEDLRQPGDIRVAQQLKVSEELIQNRHYVLEHAYNSLKPRRRRLLSTMACFRNLIEVTTLDKLFADEIAQRSHNEQHYQQASDLEADLHNLLRRGLVLRNATQLDLHPIVRHYAYDRLEQEERQANHTHLRDYFATMADVPEKVQTLEELTPLIELYHHTVQAGQYDEAWELYHTRLWRPLFYQLGAYRLQIEFLNALSQNNQDKLPALKEGSDQTWALNELANSYSLNGQPNEAVPIFRIAVDLDEKQGDKENLAIDLGNLADDQMKIGSLRDAEINLRRRIALSREIKDELNEAVAHYLLGLVLVYCGVWGEAEQELVMSANYWDRKNHAQSHGLTWGYRALRALLMVRDVVGRSSSRSAFMTLSNAALTAAQQALALAKENARTKYPVQRDFVRAYWVLGAAQRVKADWAAADTHLTEALTRCRGINLVEMEADILLDIARLRVAQGNRQEGQRLAKEALIITERCGYVLQGADVHLFFAWLAFAENNHDDARHHATQARTLATCDGPPDYTYKVAYEEAGRLLGRLGD